MRSAATTTCDMCVFWARLTLEGANGMCHRYPTYIRTARYDWCGEFQYGPKGTNSAEIEAASAHARQVRRSPQT